MTQSCKIWIFNVFAFGQEFTNGNSTYNFSWSSPQYWWHTQLENIHVFGKTFKTPKIWFHFWIPIGKFNFIFLPFTCTSTLHVKCSICLGWFWNIHAKINLIHGSMNRAVTVFGFKSKLTSILQVQKAFKTCNQIFENTINISSFNEFFNNKLISNYSINVYSNQVLMCKKKSWCGFSKNLGIKKFLIHKWNSQSLLFWFMMFLKFTWRSILQKYDNIVCVQMNFKKFIYGSFVGKNFKSLLVHFKFFLYGNSFKIKISFESYI